MLCWLHLDSSCFFVFQITTLLSRLSWNLKLSNNTFLIFSVPCNNLLIPPQSYPNTGSEYLAWLHLRSSQQALRWCDGSPVLQIVSRRRSSCACKGKGMGLGSLICEVMPDGTAQASWYSIGFMALPCQPGRPHCDFPFPSPFLPLPPPPAHHHLFMCLFTL